MRIRAVVVGIVLAIVIIVVVSFARTVYDLGVLALGVIGFVVLGLGAYLSRMWLRR